MELTEKPVTSCLELQPSCCYSHLRAFVIRRSMLLKAFRVSELLFSSECE